MALHLHLVTKAQDIPGIVQAAERMARAINPYGLHGQIIMLTAETRAAGPQGPVIECHRRPAFVGVTTSDVPAGPWIPQMQQRADCEVAGDTHVYCPREWPGAQELLPHADSVKVLCRPGALRGAGQCHLSVGCMFAGKSLSAIQLVQRRMAVKADTLAVSHAIDQRYTPDSVIAAHNLQQLRCVTVSSLMGLLDTEAYRHSKCVVIDEAQFFTDLVPFVQAALKAEKSVHVFGLDGTARRSPFGQIRGLLPLAHSAVKLTAFCHRCRGPQRVPAIFTHCLDALPDNDVLVGGASTYEALCRWHWLQANGAPRA